MAGEDRHVIALIPPAGYVEPRFRYVEVICQTGVEPAIPMAGVFRQSAVPLRPTRCVVPVRHVLVAAFERQQLASSDLVRHAGHREILSSELFSVTHEIKYSVDWKRFVR